MKLTADIRFHLEGGRYATLRFKEEDDRFVLDLVLVPSQNRGAGIGRLLIGRLLDLADLLQKDVVTTARPVGLSAPGTLERLVKYYEGFGFETIERRVSSVTLVRRARQVAEVPCAGRTRGM